MRSPPPKHAVIILAIGAVLAEGVARLAYKAPWYERLAAAQASSEAGEIAVNSLGLRDREYAPEKPANATRILMLGDSFTFGKGVADDSAIFPSLVEERLGKEAAARGRTLEVMNGGLSGSLTSLWLDLLRKAGPTFKPDVIVIVFFLRDGTRSSSMGAFFDPIRHEIIARNQASPAYRASALYRWWRDARDRDAISEAYTKTIQGAYFGTAEQTAEWRIAQQNLLSMKSEGEGMGARVALVVFPILAAMDEGYPFARVQETVLTFGREHGFETLDLRAAFRGQDPADLWVSAVDQHPNPRGHQLAADAMLPFLRRLMSH